MANDVRACAPRAVWTSSSADRADIVKRGIKNTGDRWKKKWDYQHGPAHLSISTQHSSETIIKLLLLILNYPLERDYFNETVEQAVFWSAFAFIKAHWLSENCLEQEGTGISLRSKEWKMKAFH